MAFLLKHKQPSLPVVDDHGYIIGIVSEADLLRAIRIETQGAPQSPSVVEYGAPNRRDQLARDVMCRNVITVTKDIPLTALLNHFETHGLTRMPVIKDGMIVGSVDRQDLLRALVALSEQPADRNSEKRTAE